MASGKTGSEAYRPLNIWQRWKLHHAVKALRSPFHSVRVAAHREIAKILSKGRKATKRAGRQIGTAARAPRDWLSKLGRALWGHKHGWDHITEGRGRGKGAPVPIRQAEHQAGRGRATRTGPVLTKRVLKERARNGTARNGAGDRGAEDLDLSRNPLAMALNAKASDAAATERLARAQEQANRQPRGTHASPAAQNGTPEKAPPLPHETIRDREPADRGSRGRSR